MKCLDIEKSLGDHFVSKMKEYAMKAGGKETFATVFFFMVAYGCYSLCSGSSKANVMERILKGRMEHSDAERIHYDFSDFAKTIVKSLEDEYSPEELGNLVEIVDREGLDSFENVARAYQFTNLFYPGKASGYDRSIDKLVNLLCKNHIVWK